MLNNKLYFFKNITEIRYKKEIEAYGGLHHSHDYVKLNERKHVDTFRKCQDEFQGE